MGLKQLPPTESGIVVISGSDMFGLTGDFPVIQGLVFDSFVEHDEPIELIFSSDPQTTQDIFESIAPVGLIFITPAEGAEGERQDNNIQILEVLDMNPGGDVNITSTSVTTSGIVLFDMFPGAGSVVVPFVPPVVLNERFFPLFQGPFPEHDSRIYPRLPQFSILTPGD